MQYPKEIRQVGLLYRLAYVVFHPYFKTFVRLQYSGGDNLPQHDGAILACNHLSKFDPINIGYAFGVRGVEVHFMAKAELFRIPLLGPLLTKWGMVPVERGAGKASNSLYQAQKALEEGQKIGVFVEGTLTRDPDFWPMQGKTGAARLALDSGAPLLPVVQWGTQNVMERYQSRLRLKETVVHVALLPPIDLSDLPQDSADRQAVQEATRRLLEAMRDGLAGIRGETPPTTTTAVEAGLDKKSLAKLSKWRRQLGKASRTQEILVDQ